MAKDLVSALRTRLADDRASVAAFTLSVTAQAQAATLEVANGFFMVHIEQGAGVSSLRLPLSMGVYRTVQDLASYLSQQRGYQVTADASLASDHSSADLRVDGMPDISQGRSYLLKHRIFSDEELDQYLADAVVVHNPTYTVSTVPESEWPYVLDKAQARAYRVMAAQASRLKGIGAEANTMLALANDLERQYDANRSRMARVIPVPKADMSRVGTGDAIQGALTRRSLRSGFTSSYRNSVPLSPPILLELADDDVGDTEVRLRWSQSRDQKFSHYELWRDTQPNVERNLQGRLNYTAQSAPYLPNQTPVSRAGTSRMVFGGSGHRYGSGYDGLTSSLFIDGHVANAAQGTNRVFRGDPLEPGFTYYYRLYLFDWNGEAMPSDVLRVTTKSPRALFLRSTDRTAFASGFLAPLTGALAGGTTVTVIGTHLAGAKLSIAGKDCVEVANDGTTLVCLSPGMNNADFVSVAQDVVLTSPNGLRDIAVRAWTYL